MFLEISSRLAGKVHQDDLHDAVFFDVGLRRREGLPVCLRMHVRHGGASCSPVVSGLLDLPPGAERTGSRITGLRYG